MTKNLKTWLFSFFLLTGYIRADWKTDLQLLINTTKPDYAKALMLVEDKIPSLTADDRQLAGALLPFFAKKTEQLEKEEKGVIDFFETYGDNYPDISFLDPINLQAFLSFWSVWRAAYPLVKETNFLYYDQASFSNFPATVDIGLELGNDAFYRISLNGIIFEGGYWPSGYHILTIPVASIFLASGSYEFLLDLKTEKIILRKPIRLSVDLQEYPISTPPPASPAVFPPVTSAKQAQVPDYSLSALEGEISLYIGDKLILRSRKFAPKLPPISIPIPGPSIEGQKPYLPPPKTDSLVNSVSIMDAIALAYKAIKDLMSRKPPPPVKPSYQKVTSLTYSFTKNLADGTVTRVKAVLSLNSAGASILSE